MNIAICDGEAERAVLQSLIGQMLSEASVPGRFRTFENGDALLDEWLDGAAWDLVVIDMHIPPVNGLQTARRLRASGYRGILLLESTDMRGAVSSYTVEAAGFLLKPYQPASVQRTVERVLQRLRTELYGITSHGRTEYRPLSELMYIESDNTRCRIHTVDRVYTVYKSLNQLETELNSRLFLRCHQSYLVNMNFIRSAGNTFVLTDGTALPIRQRGRRVIRDCFSAFAEDQRQLRIDG